MAMRMGTDEFIAWQPVSCGDPSAPGQDVSARLAAGELREILRSVARTSRVFEVGELREILRSVARTSRVFEVGDLRRSFGAWPGRLESSRSASCGDRERVIDRDPDPSNSGDPSAFRYYVLPKKKVRLRLRKRLRNKLHN